VKICGSSCGLSDFGDGKTHQSIEDGNIIKTLPNLTVLNPVDAVETKKIVEAALKHKGPVYIRVNRNDLPVFTKPEGEYQIGKMYPIIDGKDIAIFATGIMVSKSVEAAAILAKEGISAQVINVSSLKPLLKEEILKYAKGKKAIVTAEEAVKIGGLGSEIAAAIIGEINVPFEQVAIDDKFGTSAHNYEELLTEYGLTVENIVKAAKKT
jgi:transketolase